MDKIIILMVLANIMAGCAQTAPRPASTFYTQSEISGVLARTFDGQNKALQKALRPTFQKYGQPKGYIAGQMSSVVDDKKDRLLGVGAFQAKFKLPIGTYWEIAGENLSETDAPIPAIHLVYDTLAFTRLNGDYERHKSLSRRGQTFTVFEHTVDEKVIVTVYKTADLPATSGMDSLAFSPAQRYGAFP